MDFSVREAVPEVTYLYPAIAAAWVLMGRQPVYVAARPEDNLTGDGVARGFGLMASVYRPARRSGSRSLSGCRWPTGTSSSLPRRNKSYQNPGLKSKFNIRCHQREEPMNLEQGTFIILSAIHWLDEDFGSLGSVGDLLVPDPFLLTVCDPDDPPEKRRGGR